MPNVDQGEKPKTVQVPQYEEFRTGNLLSTVIQWLGGIGLCILGLGYLRFPELVSDEPWMPWIVGILMTMFLIPAIRSGARYRENQRISSRNQKKYDLYRSALKPEDQETK